MNLKNTKGDLLDFPEGINIVCHCANCQCTMQSGIAKQIKERFPAAYKADLGTKKGDRSKLGTYTRAKVGENQFIVNFYAQFEYGRDKRNFDYEAFIQCLEKFFDTISGQDFIVGFPKFIGCDRAMGEWEIVENIIHVFSKKYKVKVIIVEWEKNT